MGALTAYFRQNHNVSEGERTKKILENANAENMHLYASTT